MPESKNVLTDSKPATSAGKIQYSLLPPSVVSLLQTEPQTRRGLAAAARAMESGLARHARGDYAAAPSSPETALLYLDACLRHYFAGLDQPDADSGLPHRAHLMAGLLILINVLGAMTVMRAVSGIKGHPDLGHTLYSAVKHALEWRALPGSRLCAAKQSLDYALVAAAVACAAEMPDTDPGRPWLEKAKTAEAEKVMRHG